LTAWVPPVWTNEALLVKPTNSLSVAVKAPPVWLNVVY